VTNVVKKRPIVKKQVKVAKQTPREVKTAKVLKLVAQLESAGMTAQANALKAELAKQKESLR